MNSDEFLQYVREQLRELGEVKIRRMFGGAGVYCRELFFAIVDDDVLYFKTSEATRERYLKAESQPFQATPTMTIKSYYEVPADVLENRAAITEWALEAIAAAGEADKTKRRSAKSAKKKAAKKKPAPAKKKSKVAAKKAKQKRTKAR